MSASASAVISAWQRSANAQASPSAPWHETSNAVEAEDRRVTRLDNRRRFERRERAGVKPAQIAVADEMNRQIRRSGKRRRTDLVPDQQTREIRAAGGFREL